jgi:hypothetical protein
MFIVTAKLTKAKAAAVLIGFFILIAAIILIVSFCRAGGTDTVTTAAEVDVSFKNIKDNAARITFLNAFGWEISEQPVSIEEVVIPEEFGEIYEEYNALQQSQGLNLKKYKGKTVRRYTYEVLNYQGQEDKVYANLLIYKNRVIGADVCSSKLEGFMHGLMAP